MFQNLGWIIETLGREFGMGIVYEFLFILGQLITRFIEGDLHLLNIF